MAVDLDQLDRALLDLIQQQVPLEPRPFALLADRIGVTEQDVLTRINRLKARPDGVIRQIGAIFDSRALGYTSCLVAAKVDEARIESAAAAISAHPGVSHNYRRDHAYNLWYTVAVPPDSRLGLQKTVDLLHRESGAHATRLMPSLKLYKIGVKFNLGDSEAVERTDQPAFDSDRQNAGALGFKVTHADKRMIRVLQQDLPIEAEPFARWAIEANVSVDELLGTARRYESIGSMRRFSAVLRHRQAGFGANAMGAWIVPVDRQDEFGHIAAGFSAVSHCYLRPSYPDWPYSLFTMVHGQSREVCEQVLAEISRQTRIADYAALYSTHEYKKVRVRYFTGDIEAWEAAALAASQKKE